LNAKPTGFTPLFSLTRSLLVQKKETPPTDTKEIWTFSRDFFALLDRGRVWIVGTEDGK
jgi:hypothetical protein